MIAYRIGVVAIKTHNPVAVMVATHRVPIETPKMPGKARTNPTCMEFEMVIKTAGPGERMVLTAAARKSANREGSISMSNAKRVHAE